MTERKTYVSIKAKLSGVILAILFITVVINSLINIVSFKSIYQRALEEKSYALGRALRRTVYNNLRYFPLDSFTGMNAYLQSIIGT